MTHLRVSDVQVMDAEPRIQDLKLAAALAFGKPYDVRKLIQRNIDELSRYGEIFATVAKNDDENGRGRPGTEYHLNEPQCLLTCMFSRTEKAADVRQDLIRVFTDFKKGKLRYVDEAAADIRAEPPKAPEVFATVAKTSVEDTPVAVKSMKLRMVYEARQLFGVAAAQRLWRSQGLPDAEPELPWPEQVPREAAECLATLLSYKLECDRVITGDETISYQTTIGQMILNALNGDLEDEGNLKHYGIHVLPYEPEPRFLICNQHDSLRRYIFKGTRWEKEGWRAALKLLPGSQVGRVIKIDATRSSASRTLPASYLDDLPA